ncbi:hypothetical protein [Kordia sp.]|uniref:hypothetical protein n=1 Tax=Kordia sp. TaxID=1965332 RepID=UPI003B5BABAB
MKKKRIKNLQLKKKTVANFQEKLKGGHITTTLITVTCLMQCYTLQDEPWCWEAKR